MSTVRYIVEGATDRSVAIRLIQRSGLEPQVARVGGGKTHRPIRGDRLGTGAGSGAVAFFEAGVSRY